MRRTTHAGLGYWRSGAQAPDGSRRRKEPRRWSSSGKARANRGLADVSAPGRGGIPVPEALVGEGQRREFPGCSCGEDVHRGSGYACSSGRRYGVGCVFCQIAGGEVPADIVYADDQVLAFRDIRPQAPVHLLIVPRRHIPNLSEVQAGDEGLLLDLWRVATHLAEREGLWPEGYRVVINTGPQGGQTVAHLHLHLLGGRAMGWPPG